MGARAATFAVSILLASSVAHAGGLGEACAVTKECEPTLRCIGGRCLSTARGAPRQRTSSDVALFGEGRGYSGAIVGADVFGLVGTTAFLAVAASLSTPYRTGWQVAAVVPFAFGPIVHATHRRWGAAIVSFFGWASLDMAAVAASLMAGSCDDCAVPGTAVELGLLAIGGTLLTWLDAWMARDLGAATRAGGVVPHRRADAGGRRRRGRRGVLRGEIAKSQRRGFGVGALAISLTASGWSSARRRGHSRLFVRRISSGDVQIESFVHCILCGVIARVEGRHALEAWDGRRSMRRDAG